MRPHLNHTHRSQSRATRLSIILLGLATGCGEAAPEKAIPMEWPEARVRLAEPTRTPLGRGMLPVIDGGLADRAPLRFLVDTASELSLILGASPPLGFGEAGELVGRTELSGSDENPVHVSRFVEARDLTFGSLVIEQANFLLIEVPLLERYGIQGVLGMDVLGQVSTLFDLRGGTVHFLPSSMDAGELMAFAEAVYPSDAWERVELGFDPVPTVELEVDGLNQPIRLHLDTGATSSSLPASAFAQLDLDPRGRTPYRTISGTHSQSSYFVEGASLYGHPIRGRMHDTQAELGLLGLDIARGFVFLVDGPRQQLLLAYRDRR